MKTIFCFLLMLLPWDSFAISLLETRESGLKYLEGEYVLGDKPTIHYVNGERVLSVIIKRREAKDLLGAIIHDTDPAKTETIEKVQKFVVTTYLIFEPVLKNYFVEINIQGFLDKKLVYETHEFYESRDRSFIFTPPPLLPSPPPAPKKEEKKKESKIPRRHPSNSDGIMVLV